MAFQARHRWIIGKINECLGISDEHFVEKSLKDEESLAGINRFFKADGPDRLLFFYQSRETGWEGDENGQEESLDNNNNGDVKEIEGAGDNNDRKLFVTDGLSVGLTGQCVYFFRVRLPGKEKVDLDPTVAGDKEISFGTVNASLLHSYESVLAQALKPLVDVKENWNKASVKESREFCIGLNKFVSNVQDNLKSLSAGLELQKPHQHLLEVAMSSTRVPSEAISHFIELLTSWCGAVEAYLDEDEESKWDSGEKGPYTELEYWRRRTQRLTSITEQLKGKECRTVINALQSLTKTTNQPKFGGAIPFGLGGGGGAFAPSNDMQMQNVMSLLRRWRQIDINITEAANEAKDNVKYLATLEKFIDPLYNGTPVTIIDTLPALMNSIKMIHTIARYYNTTERMTTLFMKISNQMIANCKEYLCSDPNKKQNNNNKDKMKSSSSNVAGGGGNSGSNKEEAYSVDRIWERDPEELLTALETCLRLNEAYQEQYHITKDKLLTMPKGRQFDFSETQIFGKMDLFCRRIIKLIDMFSTIHQFRSLAKHGLEGMEGLTSQFQRIVTEFRNKEHDLLDFYNNKFDRDYIQFNVRITDLETLLQQFINRSFESITSIEASLTLLKKFQTILQRENLRSDLDSKFTVIFHNYGLDLTTVQELYEKHKHSPPISRNMPPVAGSIMWARHLLRRIEEPMRKFEMNASVLGTKDSKKIIKTYNKVAKTLVAFEYLWYEAWCNSVESARAGLQATLIIRHPQSKKLFVNFDSEILQLIREAKCLARIGIEIPTSAQMVLLQENKFKHYYNELTYLLREYDRVISMILPIAKEMLAPHIADLDMTLRPGLVTLTWTSMNIDSYKQTVQAALVKFEELVVNLSDIIDNRVEKNLKKVGKALLVDLPTDGLVTLDEFVTRQEKFVKEKTKFLDAKNIEIETAVMDIIRHVKQYKFFTENIEVTEEHYSYIIRHYNKMMYQGLLQATKNSLAAIKERVCAKSSTGFLYLVKPFFEVDVQLSVPSVRLVPSLDEVQSCINKSAQSILWCTKSIWDWGQLDVKLVENVHTGECNKVSFFERIGQDVQVVRSVLLLTGALLGTKNNVKEYLAGFSQYDWLWKEDMEYMYKKFVDRNPTIEEFEHELSKFVSIENQIRGIAGVHNIGALSLNTSNLKLQLQSEASQWKVQYSDKVHQQASEAMGRLFEYIRVTTQRVQREVDSLESLRYVMGVLKEVRERESTIEQEITPILDMYDMLDHYLPSGVVKKEEMDEKSIIRSTWRKLGDLAEEITDELAGIQGKFKVQLIRDVKTFAQDVVAFRESYVEEGPMVPGLKPKEAVERLRRFKSEFELRSRKQETLAAGEELFALRVTDYPELTRTRKELTLLDQLYSLYIDVVDTMEQYRNQSWMECVKTVEAMDGKVAEFENRCKRLPLKLRDWDAYRDLRHDLTDFQNILPLLLELSKPSIKNRHWAQVCQLTGIKFDTENSKLRELWHPTMLSHREEIEEICHGADKELEIEEKVGQIKEKWAAEHFQFTKWRQRDTVVLRGFGHIVEELEESQLTCQSMLSMRHVKPFKEEVSNILGQLSETGETLERWIKVQLLWMSLESVFTGGDIARQMPQDAKKFAKIDKDFHKIMERAQESMGNVISCCSNELLKNSLPILYTELEKCQKSLEGYLEQKRAKFPRFYFVSNPVLLQVLSQGSDVESVQPYYEKIFDSISQVTHDEKDVHQILEMKSISGVDQEVVPFSNPVHASGNIEDWLISLEKEMQQTMKDICREAAAECHRTELLQFINRFTAQFALLGLQMNWTAQVNSALSQCRSNKSIMSETNKLQLAILTKLSSLCLTDLGSKMNRRKIETLVTIQVHQRDVFNDLFRLFKDRKIHSVNDFEWLKQARFFWSNEGKDQVMGDGKCTIAVCDTSFDYSYEYLGCKERLVITPLTDRCYVTLTQALGMHLGGAPAGPAGTGKTETVKDLGRTLGIYVVVTNCTDQQRYTDMAKIFKGLCRAGIWGCFDEFNRIELPVLSVVAQQILAITNAKRMQNNTLTFPGDPDVITLQNSVGYFITMNPGYAGRQELPENLKALFRSVAMMVPDREIIIRVRLCSVGYTKFTELAKKFNTLYRCCEEQLSKQRHYDFGLRNILSVLRTAGQTKRDNQDSDEHILVMKTLRDMNLSKFVAQDVPLFLSLLADLFPSGKDELSMMDQPGGNDKKKESGSALPRESLTHALKTLKLQPHDRWLLKVQQVYDTSLVRHGLMLIGPSGGGKSKCLEALTETLTHHSQVSNKLVRMNPKAIRAEEMFGETDPASQEWIDGVFASLWQKFNDRSRRDNVWLVCDGPVDAIWIENLNTVLDDNKILTLANGDRIPMTDNVKLVFETENLDNASPATVSRAGIIYVSETDLDWEPVLESWIQLQQEAHMPILRELFERYIKETDFFTGFRRLFRPVIARSRVNVIVSMYGLLEPLINAAKLSDSPSDAEKELEKLFLFALIWTFGGVLEINERKHFDKFVRSLHSKSCLPKLNGGDDTCFNYHLNLPDLDWVRWVVPEWQPQSNDVALTYRKNFNSLLIPTADSERAMYIMNRLHKRKIPILLVGAPGTAKSSTALMFFNQCNNAQMLFKKINFSSATSPKLFQEAIEGEVDKRGGKTFGPPNGHQMTLFLDDVSMPEANDWGDKPTLEIVRQLVETKGIAFLDKDKRGDFKNFEDVQFMAAMTHYHQPKSSNGSDGPEEGSQDQEELPPSGIPNRLLRHFYALNVVTPDNKAINAIYGQMMRMCFSSSPKVLGVIDKLIGATVAVWTKIKISLLPTPSKFHYVFTMRDLSRVFQGILRTPASVIGTDDKVIYQLWRHEIDRVFCDKLTCEVDKNKLASVADDIAQKEFGKDAPSWFYYPSNPVGMAPRNTMSGNNPAQASPKGGRKESTIGMGGIQSAAQDLVTFVDFLRPDEYDEDGILVEEAPKVYEPAPSIDFILDKVRENLEGHNTEHPYRAMDLVLFRDALRHLLRVVRVLGLPRGNLLLVGVGGSGKQSITKLATYIAKHHLFQIKLTKSYNLNSLLEDMRALYRKVGKEGQAVTFLITEAEIRDESFLEVFSSFLTSGEIVGLFPKDEIAVMASELRTIALKENPKMVDTPENMSRYFIDTIRNNLHIVLCMSPISAKYMERARRFPSLFSNSVIDWFLPWPKEALHAVSSAKLGEFDMEATSTVRSSIIAHMGDVHAMAIAISDEYFEQMRKRVYQTPKSFLSFLTSFKSMYQQNLAKLLVKEERIEIGLKKLAKGAQDVEQMKVLLAQEELKLRDAEKACNSMLTSLEHSSLEAKKEAAAVSKIKSECEAEAALIAEEKNAAAADLALAQPFLDEAENAVNSIKPNDLNELKKLPKPGDIIKLTFDGVMILRMFRMNSISVNKVSLGIGKEKKRFDFIQDSYALCQKTMLSDSNFLKSLFRFSEHEKDQINEETIELLMPYLELEGFHPVVARNASKACEGLCSWVIAMVKYHRASKVVKPKLEKLAAAQAKLEAALSDLQEAENTFQKCKDKLEALQEKFQTQMSEKQQIEERTNASKRKMEQATALIDGLKDERERWTEDGKVFAETKRRLIGDCALASAFLSYCGPFNQDFRVRFMQEKLFADLVKNKVPVSTLRGDSTKMFDLTGFLVDPVALGDWNMQGLPTDQLSIENGLLVTRSTRYPLLIDPQGQALQWIRNKEASRIPNFGVTTLHHPRFRDQLEFCMAEGMSLIIVGIEEEVDPLLDPVLEQQVVTRGKAKYITISDKPCEFSDSFLLFLTTRLPKPNFSPELQAKTTVIDFAVTTKGLEEQLLGQVIRKEQRALEDQLSEVMESVTTNTRRLHELNADLLQRLTENTGNLLDDSELVSVLAHTKKAALEVNEKLQVADDTKVSINEKREQYRAVAARGSVLYFAIVDMSNINPMYQTSLDQFMRLFIKSMEDAERAPSVARRVAAVISTLTYSVYRYVNRGLYKKDKLTFVLLMLLRIMVDAGQLNAELVRLFLRGGAQLDINSVRPNKLNNWLPDTAYLNLCALSKIEFFKQIVENIFEKESLWKRWFEDNEPESMALPDYEQKLNSELGAFYRLLLVRCLREDRTALAVNDFIRLSENIESCGAMQPCLGPQYATPVSDSIESVYDSMSPDVPALYLLSSGADPTDSIVALCKRKKQNVTCVSMGEGQDKVALKVLSASIGNGDWVLLQNCHLDLKFMEQLCDILDQVKASVSSLMEPEMDKDNNNTNDDMADDDGNDASNNKHPQQQQHQSQGASSGLAVNPKFRLFITTEPHAQFPIALLQRSLKVTNEPPAGLKAGMLHSYTELIDQEKLDRVENVQWRKTMYVICFLHSIVQERRKFGALGWNIPYEFNSGDLQASLCFIEKHLFAGEVSWPAVQYMVGEVQYGGRVTDDCDRHLLVSFTEKFLTANMLIPGFKFNPEDAVQTIPDDFVYDVPDFNEIEMYVTSINQFPDVDSAEILGLHPNADITSRVQASQALLNSIIDTQPKDSGTGADGMSREAMVSAMAKDLLGKIPTIISMNVCMEHLSKLGGLGVPSNIVCYQEFQRLRLVVTNAEATLKSLIQAIAGEVVMTQELSDCLDALFLARVPKSWMFSIAGDEISWRSSSIANWFVGLNDRYNQLMSWMTNGKPNSFWLTGFFNPQGFLNSIKQEVCRQNEGWALDNVDYQTSVTTLKNSSQVRAPPKQGVYVHGLVLEGADWNIVESTLQESQPKVLFVDLPVMHVTVAQRNTMKAGELGPFGGYCCPLYKYPNRHDLIVKVMLPSKEQKPVHFTLRGTALLLSSDM